MARKKKEIKMNFTTTHSHFKFLKKYFHYFSTCVDFRDCVETIKKIAKEVANDCEKENEHDWYCYDTKGKQIKLLTKEELKKKISSKVKGDLFEIFVEVFLKWVGPADVKNQFGYVGNWRSFPDGEDAGEDNAYSLSNGGTASGQCKFKGKEDACPLLNDVFCKLFTWGVANKTFDINNPKDRLIFFTNIYIKDHEFSTAISDNFQRLKNKPIFKKRVVIVSGETFEQYLKKGRESFWQAFAETTLEK